MSRRKRRIQSTPFIIFCTVGSTADAQKIARFLIRNRLAACVNMIPQVDSFFRWKGSMDQAKELLLIIKTEKACLGEVEKAIRKNHSYQVPEVIGWPIPWSSGPYLKWLSESVTRKPLS